MSTRSALQSIPVNTSGNTVNTDAKLARRQTMAAPPSVAGTGRKSLGGAQRRQSVSGRKSLGSRMSLSSSRLSMGGPRNRRSSVMPSRKSAVGAKQDPRPLNDKAYMLSNIKTLIRFLTEHGYDRKLSLKVLSSPSTKDFYCMVEFLYRQIDPNYVMSGKGDDAIPAIFKSLGYPFPISKMALSAVGTPHTWPPLLAALAWMVELLTYQELVEEREAEAADTLQEDNAEKLFFNYLSAAYGTFMAGDDDNIERLDHELEEQFTKRNENVANAIAGLESDVSQLRSACTRIADAPTSLSNLNGHHATVQSDLDKFRQLIDELVAHRAAVAQKHEQHCTELETKEREIEATRKEIAALNTRLESQKLRPADVERLQSERAALERTVRALADERRQVEASAAEITASISAKREAVESALSKYHSEARRLALIPSNAANARGRSFAISFVNDEVDDETTGVQSVLSVDIKGTIVPALDATLRELREAVTADQTHLLQLSAKKEEAVETCADNDAELKRLRHRLKKAENAYSVEKQRFETELHTIEKEIEQIQSEIEQAKSATVNGLDRVMSVVTEKKAQLNALLSQFDDEKAALANIATQMADLLAKHKEYVSDMLDATLEVVEQEIEMAK